MSRKAAWLACLILIAAVCLLAGKSLSILPPFAGDFPYLEVDHSVLYFQAENARDFWQTTNRVWGYDPFILGGTVDPFIWNSNVNFQVFSVLFSFLNLRIAYNLYMLLAFLAVPLLLFTAGRYLNPTDRSILYPFLFAWVGVCVYASSLHSFMFQSGMTSSILLLYFSLVSLSLLASFLRHGRRQDAWLLVAFSALTLLVHKKALITIGLPAFFLIIAYAKYIAKRQWVWLTVAAAVVLTTNLFWLAPLIRLSDLAAFHPSYNHWINPDPWAFFRDLTDPQARVGIFHRPTGWPSLVLRWILLAMTIHGSVLGFRQKDKNLIAFFFGWLAIACFAYLGSLIPGLFRLDPCSMIPYVELLALPMVASSFSTLLSRIASRNMRAGVTVACLILSALPAVLPPLKPALPGMLKNPAPNADAWDELADKIRHTDRPDGRIMFETYNLFDQKLDPLPNDKTLYNHMLLPKRTGAAFLGGHYPNYFLRFNEANFSAGHLGKRRIDSFSREELLTYLEAYNVDLIIAHSQLSLATLQTKLPEAIEAWQVDQYRAFRYDPPGGYFQSGTGEIDFAMGEIRLRDLQPNASGRVVIKCHFVDHLKANDGSKIFPASVPGAVLPLIAIEPRSSSMILSF